MARTPEEKKAAKALYDKNRRKDPLFLAADKIRRQERNSRPEVKARRNARSRERNKDPEVKAARKAFDLARRSDPAYCAAENKYSREYMRERRKDSVYRDEMNAYARERRKGDTSYLAGQRAYRADKLRKFTLLKLGRPCYDCGGVFSPECMDWDHLPGKEKLFCIGKNLQNRSVEAVFEEISKCQLVCSNCHRTRTIKRRQEAK